MRGLLKSVWTWGEMIRFSHSVFALPFALLAAFLAARPQRPTGGQLVLIVAAMVAARSAAMTFNRLADVRLDAENPRTAGRALPRGLITPGAAWVFWGLACGLFVLACAGFWRLYGNPWPIVLCGPVLLFLCAYSYTKRLTSWSHLILGTAIAFSPVAAWIAISPQTLGLAAGLLMVAVAFWIGGFDIIYACQDADFDRLAGLRSFPARLGIGLALWMARAFHAVTVAALIAVGLSAGLGSLYYVGVGCVAVLLVVENALVSPDDLSRVNLAFFSVNGIVGLVLGGLGILDVVLQ